jgi:hypothetical protein
MRAHRDEAAAPGGAACEAVYGAAREKVAQAIDRCARAPGGGRGTAGDRCSAERGVAQGAAAAAGAARQTAPGRAPGDATTGGVPPLAAADRLRPHAGRRRALARRSGWAVGTLVGLALLTLPPSAAAQRVQPRYPALQPAPSGSSTQGPPKGGAQTQETGTCSPVPCTTGALEAPRRVLALDAPESRLRGVRPVADAGPESKGGAAPGQDAEDPSRVATLEEVFARVDPLRDRRLGVSVGFCVARPRGEEKPAPVRLALVEARPGSTRDGKETPARVRSQLELRFVWRAVGENARGEPKDCYLAAQAYKRRPRLLVLRGLPPRAPDGLRIANAFQIDVLEPKPTEQAR